MKKCKTCGEKTPDEDIEKGKCRECTMGHADDYYKQWAYLQFMRQASGLVGNPTRMGMEVGDNSHYHMRDTNRKYRDKTA